MEHSALLRAFVKTAAQESNQFSSQIVTSEILLCTEQHNPFTPRIQKEKTQEAVMGQARKNPDWQFLFVGF